MQTTDTIVYVGKKKKEELRGNVIEAVKEDFIVVQIEDNKYKLQYNETDQVFDGKVFGTYLFSDFKFKKDFTASKTKGNKFHEIMTVKAKRSKSGLPGRYKRR